MMYTFEKRKKASSGYLKMSGDDMKFNGRNVKVGKNVEIGDGVRLGDNVTIYDNVKIGDRTVVCNDCVLGEPTAAYYSSTEYINPQLIIGANSLLRSHSIIYAGSVIGDNFQTGHRVTIRENTAIGRNCSIGTLSDIQGFVTMGDYVRLHSNVHIGQKSILGNFVFVYPYVVFTNDPTPPSDSLIGPVVDDYAQISVMSVLLPGVRVGKHALVGAHSLVSKDVPEFSLVVGNPAKVVKDVREIRDRTTGEPHYPWPIRFSRGMPWENGVFSEWELTENTNGKK